MPKTIKSDQEVLSSEVYSVEELYSDFEKEGVDGIRDNKLKETSTHVIASFLNRLPVKDCRGILRRFSELDASAIMAEMNTDTSAHVVAAMREWRALKILEEFEPDDAADVIEEMDKPDQVRLLSKLDPEKANKVRALLKYAPDTAGGVMTPNFFAVQMDIKVDEAIEEVRRMKDEVKHMSYVYVVDKEGKLRGVFSMKNLILASSQERVADLMNTDLKGVCLPEEDREKIALTMAELNLYDLPVVDKMGRLLGMVEHDDVIDIIQEEATEDFQKLVGAGADEAIHDNLAYSMRRRGPWLMVNLFTAFAAAAVISLFQDEIERYSLLAVFMAAVASLGGNAGAQTLAIAIRSLAVGDVEKFDSLRICMNEGIKGIVNGVIIGIFASTAVYLITIEVKMAAVVFLAMMLNMGVGGLAGAFIPLMLRRVGFDPAQSSSIFLTAVTDVCGFFIFLSLGAWLLF